MARRQRVELITGIFKNGATRNRELPFSELILAGLSGDEAPKIAAPELANNMTALFERYKPKIKKLTIKRRIAKESSEQDAAADVAAESSDEIEINLSFQRMSDFGRAGIAAMLADQIPELKRKIEALKTLEEFANDMTRDTTLEKVRDYVVDDKTRKKYRQQ